MKTFFVTEQDNFNEEIKTFEVEDTEIARCELDTALKDEVPFDRELVNVIREVQVSYYIVVN